MSQTGAQPLPYRWKPLIICPHAEISRSLLNSLGLADSWHTSEYPRPGAAAALVAQYECNVCFLDVYSNEALALPLISETASAAPVVALSPHSDGELILRCLRHGACEFLSDATTERVHGVLEHLRRLRGPADNSKPQSVYCVLPGKPGCGASTLAVHLALEMKRSGTERVLLVDADCQTGSIAFLLKLKPDFHLGDAVRDCIRLDEDLWTRLVVPCQGIDVLTAPYNQATPVELNRLTAMELICFWRERYDAVVLDLAGAHGPGCDWASLADHVLLVTTNELAALDATRRAIELLEQSGSDRGRLKLLVNRYTPATGMKREDVERALQLAPYAVLSNDYVALQNAVLEGKPASRSTHFGRSIWELTERLQGKSSEPKKQTPLFGRLSLRRLSLRRLSLRR